MSIVDVAFACGHISPPHFSKYSRGFYGIPPRDEPRLKKPSRPDDKTEDAKAAS